MRPPLLKEIGKVYFDHPVSLDAIPASTLITNLLEKEGRKAITPAKLRKEFEIHQQAHPGRNIADFWIRHAIQCDAMLFLLLPDTPTWKPLGVPAKPNRVGADIVQVVEAMWKEGKEVFALKPEDCFINGMKLWQNIKPVHDWSWATPLTIEQTLALLQAGGWQQRDEEPNNTPAYKIASGD